MQAPALLSYLKRNWFLFLFLFMYVLLQLPFRQADADSMLSHSRGPWTDEGIYTMQVRNLVNHGVWNVSETDAFLRAPLFSLLLLPLFFVFGTHHETARFFVLGIVLLTIYLLHRKKVLPQLFIPFCIVLFGDYPIFQHAHIVITDLPAACMMLLALASFQQSFADAKNKHAIVQTQLWLLMAAFMKVAFVFGLGIVFSASALLWFTTKSVVARRQFVASVLSITLAVCLFVFAWYLPNQQFVQKLLAWQSEIHFDDTLLGMWNRLKSNHDIYLHDTYLGWCVGLFYVNMAGLLALVLLRKRLHFTHAWIAATLFALCWLGIECIKFLNFYLPSRYLISSSCVNILLFFLLLEIFWPLLGKMKPIVAMMICVIALAFNTWQNKPAYARRTYVLHGIDHYLQNAAFDRSRPVMGYWASACSWDSKVLMKSLIRGFLNDSNTLQRFHPVAVITETDEGESDGVFAAQGVNLAEQADSVQTFRMHKWEIGIYWLK